MPESLLQAWQSTCRRHGRRVAVTEAATGRRVTFAQMAKRAEAWAEKHAGPVLRRRAVVFSTPNGAPWLEIFLGLLQAEAVAVPLDPGELTATLATTSATLRAAAWWDGGTLQMSPPKPRVYRDPALALVKLTSGSTGAPRPLLFTHAQLLADGRQVMRGMGIAPRDVNYALIPFGHSYGLGNLVMPLLAAGVPIVVGAAAFPYAIAADFARWRPTVFPGVPALWRGLSASGARLRGLRLPISAGGPLAPEVAQAFHRQQGVRIHGFYGSSETGGISYDRSGNDTLAGRVGRPLPGVAIESLRGDRLRVTSAAVVTHGRRSARRDRVGSWIMADRVELDRRGSLRIIGREGNWVKLAGRRVALGDVSAQLRTLPGVSDVWVGVSTGNEPVLGAAVVTTLPETELRSLARARLASWKVPKLWLRLPTLPQTARGKVDAAALQRRLFGLPVSASPAEQERRS